MLKIQHIKEGYQITLAVRMLAAPITTFRRSVFRPILPSFSKLSKEMATEDSSCRVLSIQSHVVSGYVGNKAAVFPMQVLGFDVDFINSVQFSNHTGYPNKLKGTVLSGTELLALSTGLSDNYLLDYDYLLTGYIGQEKFALLAFHLVTSMFLKDYTLNVYCAQDRRHS